MKIAAIYSHLNGLEFLMVHKPMLWNEIQDVILGIDAQIHKTKISKEKRMMGRLLYAPTKMNAAIKQGFKARAWDERRVNFFVTSDPKLTREILHLESKAQRVRLVAAGRIPFPSYNQTDFYKDRVMVEVQFGKYSFIAHDLFVKHMAFYTTDYMDVGVEILPTKMLQAQMSSGVPYYEAALYLLLRQGRGVPHVPLVILGVEPEESIDEKLLAAEAADEEAQIKAGRKLNREG